jgi:hypothetical protein
MQSAKLLADQLGAAGNPIFNEELISSILNGLNSTFTHLITTYSFHTRANDISYQDFQDELLSHEMLLNQHQLQTLDHSTFALTGNRPNNSQMFKGKSPIQLKVPPRQGYGFSAPRPYHNQFNRGPQYNRNNFPGNNSSANQQYSRGPHT